MFHPIQRENSKQAAALSKRDLSGLNQDEKQFAEEQFRLIYAQEMSKLSAGISQRRRVEDNLHSLDEQSSRNLKQQQLKLRTKMATIEQKRTQKLEEKTKHYKQNDERWYHKLKEIQKRFKQQKRNAIIKAKQYQQETENYWKNNKKKSIMNSRVNLSRRENYANRTQVDSRFTHSRLYEPSSRLALNQSFKTSHDSHELDNQIQMHREKSENINRKRQQYVFQKTLQKLARIDTKRKEISKKKQPKQAKPTAPKRISNFNRHATERHKDRKHSLNPEPTQQIKQASNSSLDQIIKDHCQIKIRLERQQFMQRGQIMEYSNQRARKDKIVKMVRRKVDELKTVTIRKEKSLLHLNQ